MDEDYDYEEVVTIETKHSNNHNFLRDYDKTHKKNTTTPILTNYEKTRVLSERSSQISDGSLPLIANIDRFSNSYEIAVEELKQKRIPFIICRPVGGRVEYFKLNDLNF